MSVKVVEYLDQNGYSPYADWFNTLNAQAAVKVATASMRMTLGNFSNVKGVGSGVYEYVINSVQAIGSILARTANSW
jgi:putative component of toxin-antitoxin plasmid stabilization module